MKWWAKNNKTTTRQPPDEILGEVDDFAKQWWHWWSALNPEWRERDIYTGQIIVGRVGDEEDWEEFHRPGQCGMLPVLCCLLWWSRKIVSGEQRNLWTMALEDVNWVCQRLLEDKM